MAQANQTQPRKISIPYRLEAPPASSGLASIFTVPPARKFTLQDVEIHFPSGTAGELRLYFLYGNQQVLPRVGFYSGDDIKFEEKTYLEYFSGDSVKIFYQNTSATATRYAEINIEGELE